MKKIQFDILYLVYENGNMPIDAICRELFSDSTKITSYYNRLLADKLIDDKGITTKGLELLNQYKIDNAVILAAGLSTRFVPLSYEIPKGLLQVRGQVLIERQIQQLKERGINEIVIVTGYMKEKFEYLREKYGVILVETSEFKERNNHSSLYAARKYLKNTIITSSDLYFRENIFQKYAYDSYYCSLYISGKTAERGITLDEDDKILDTFYGDKCCDIWITLGYAYFSAKFSDKIINIIQSEYDLPSTKSKFWADIQDEHLEELYMYAKKIKENIIYEFDSIEELRVFDKKYKYNSESVYLKQICSLLAVNEESIINIQSLRSVKNSMFKFECMGDKYICDIMPNDDEKINYMGYIYYQFRDDSNKFIKIYRMDKNVGCIDQLAFDEEKEIMDLSGLVDKFVQYHKRALPLCAAENIISEFANIPLTLGFQERYIMNNTYSFNMEDNFIGCEKLLPFYQKISDVCEKLFGAKYTDPRPFTGMHCIDMVLKTLTKPGDKLMILGAQYGGHASVKPVAERVGLIVSEVPYDLRTNDIDYAELNRIVKVEQIPFILIAPSDLIAIPDVKKIDTTNTVLLYDCSQPMGLIAAGLAENPLKYINNMVMFGGTHKTFPGPASGLILTNSKELHDKMEKQINPKYLRNSQMHQKISLLFALVEFEKYGRDYMRHMLHCSNYLGEVLSKRGFNVLSVNGKISSTHQIFIKCSRDEMETIYDNAYKCEVTLNKKHKKLFDDYGIRLGTQEIARYDWSDATLDSIAEILICLTKKNLDVEKVREMIKKLPEKKIKYAFNNEVCEKISKLSK